MRLSESNEENIIVGGKAWEIKDQSRTGFKFIIIPYFINKGHKVSLFLYKAMLCHHSLRPSSHCSF